MEVSGQLHAPVVLSSGLVPPVPIGFEVVWVSESVWTGWRRGKFPAPSGNWFPPSST